MKKTLIILGLIIGIHLASLNSKLYASETKETTIILVNPTYGNLEKITSLVNNNYISIPNLKVIGVYNTNSTYDFKKYTYFTKKHPYIKLEGYNLNVSMDSLYTTNSCSKIFYELFKKSDGIMFWGGDDIPPPAYKSKTKTLTDKYTGDRLYEISFLFHLLGGKQNVDFKPFLEEKPNYTVFGMCLGMQSINVATGGTLYQDIPTEIYNLEYNEDIVKQPSDNIHRSYWKGFTNDDTLPSYCFHKIKILPKTILSTMMASNIQPTVLSYHHQSVNELGMNIRLTATSLDGKVIEGIEHKKYKNVYGVQFHPEYNVLYSNTETVKLSPTDKPKTSKDILDENSQQFYKSFWSYFSNLFPLE